MTFVFVLIGIIICLAMIVIRVRKVEKRLQAYAGGRDRDLKKTKEAGIQALRYIAAYLAVFLPTIVLMMVADSNNPEPTTRNRKLYFTLAFLTKLLAAPTGVFQCDYFSPWTNQHLDATRGKLAFFA